MIRVFCMHLLDPLPYGRTTLLKVYDYYSSFWDAQKFLGSFRYFYRSSLKSLHLMYVDLYTIMILFFFKQSDLGKHCRPRLECFLRRGAWSKSTLFVIQFAVITLMAKPYCSDFKIITAIVQVPFRIFAVNVADFNLARAIKQSFFK